MVYATVKQVNLSNYLGSLGFIGGGMNAGKTSEIDTVRDRANELQLEMMVLGHHGNTRDGIDKIVAGRKDRKIEIPCLAYNENDPDEIFKNVREVDRELSDEGKGYVHIIVFDEVQLADYKKFIPILQELRHFDGRPRLPISVGLDRDFRGKMYEVARFLEGEEGTLVVKIEGYCKAYSPEGGNSLTCDALATRTLRVIKRENIPGLDVPELPFVVGRKKIVYGCVPAPHWDETKQVEGMNEATHYVSVCPHHHKVPGKDLVRQVYNFFNEERSNGGVILQKIHDKFKGERHLDSILKWLTLEGGLEVRDGKLRPREVTIHPVDGYLIAPSPDEIMKDEPETIYSPELQE